MRRCQNNGLYVRYACVKSREMTSVISCTFVGSVKSTLLDAPNRRVWMVKVCTWIGKAALGCNTHTYRVTRMKNVVYMPMLSSQFFHVVCLQALFNMPSSSTTSELDGHTYLGGLISCNGYC